MRQQESNTTKNHQRQEYLSVVQRRYAYLLPSSSLQGFVLEAMIVFGVFLFNKFCLFCCSVSRRLLTDIQIIVFATFQIFGNVLVAVASQVILHSTPNPAFAFRFSHVFHREFFPFVMTRSSASSYFINAAFGWHFPHVCFHKTSRFAESSHCQRRRVVS